MDPRQDLLSRHRGPLPEGDHAVRVHRVPAVEEDDFVALHDRAHGQQGRQMEHEVGAAVDQRDLARLERPEDPVEGGHQGREGRTRLDADLRDDDGFRGERDGNLPAIRWRWRYKVGDGGEVGESALPAQVAPHRLEMEVEVPLRVPSPPRGGERDQDPTDVPRSHVHAERHPGAVAIRVESVRVPDVRGRIARLNRVSGWWIEGYAFLDRDPDRP